MLGKKVKVTVDRPLGTYHPQHKDLYYPINYGYIEGIIAPDGERFSANPQESEIQMWFYSLQKDDSSL